MIDSIINGFLSSDFEEQDRASDKLDEVSKNLTLEQGIALLEAAALSFPPRRYNFQDTSSDLIYAVSKTINEKYVGLINKNFEKYSNEGKCGALILLTEIPTREATSSFIELMKSYARKIDLSFFRLSIPNEETNTADIFFPAILDFLDIPKIRFEILLFLLNYLQDERINISMISSYAKIIEEDYKKIETKISSIQPKIGNSWMWGEEYRDLRNEGCLLLDILGYFPDKSSLSLLKNALNFQDSRFVFFAITGLIRKDQIPEQSAFIKVASTPETRILLYEFLHNIDKQSLFPEKFKTQEHLAESDMVRWLIYPTELDTAPDEIELMHIATVENQDKELFNYYIFRFKTFEPHWAAKKGWLAGVSGPFPQKEIATTKSFGSTFSRFNSWESQSAEEHLGEITETIIKWQEYQK